MQENFQPLKTNNRVTIGLWDFRGPPPPATCCFFGFSPRFFSRSRERGEMVRSLSTARARRIPITKCYSKYSQRNFQLLKNNNTVAIGLWDFGSGRGSPTTGHLLFPAFSIERSGICRTQQKNQECPRFRKLETRPFCAFLPQ